MNEPTQQYQDKLNSKYPGKYSVLTPYAHRKIPVRVRCLLHEHEFEAVPQRLLAGTKNCPLCYKEKLTAANRRRGVGEQTHSHEQFLQSLRDRGLESVIPTLRSEYSGSKVNVIRSCPVHGDYGQLPGNALKGNGCPKCARSKNSTAFKELHHRSRFDKWLSDAKAVHSGFYLYDRPAMFRSYVNARSKLPITCPDHGEFWQNLKDHVNMKHRCPKCAVTWSKGEREIRDWLVGLGVDVVDHDRRTIAPMELDLLLPAHNLAVEYHGLRYHSTLFQPDKDYHRRKLDECRRLGIGLIQVWEDEWRDNRPVLESLLLQRLGLGGPSLHARKCEVREIPDYATVRSFLEAHHVQGSNSSSVYLGLYHARELVMVMTLGKNRALRGDSDTWELTRMASSRRVVGGAGRLFSRFLSEYDPEAVVSYSDNEKFEGGVYPALGFALVGESGPDYKTTRDFRTRRPKQATKRENLKKVLGDKFDPALTESENCAANGVYRLYDSGKKKWLWRKTTKRSA